MNVPSSSTSTDSRVGGGDVELTNRKKRVGSVAASVTELTPPVTTAAPEKFIQEKGSDDNDGDVCSQRFVPGHETVTWPGPLDTMPSCAWPASGTVEKRTATQTKAQKSFVLIGQRG